MVILFVHSSTAQSILTFRVFFYKASISQSSKVTNKKLPLYHTTTSKRPRMMLVSHSLKVTNEKPLLDHSTMFQIALKSTFSKPIVLSNGHGYQRGISSNESMEEYRQADGISCVSIGTSWPDGCVQFDKLDDYRVGHNSSFLLCTLSPGIKMRGIIVSRLCR